SWMTPGRLQLDSNAVPLFDDNSVDIAQHPDQLHGNRFQLELAGAESGRIIPFFNNAFKYLECIRSAGDLKGTALLADNPNGHGLLLKLPGNLRCCRITKSVF
ncbi:hypothetical protein JFU37_23845, partial [Pseudomonas sp. TH41]|uniref:hypothetical protein n=1 Tax=Pseudomonas sp. TH41 TaxID=2796405 RepID=UPI001913BB37